jgi:hypothetical protein
MTAPVAPVVVGTPAGALAIGQAAPVADGNSGAAFTVDWTKGATHKSTLTANCTYTFTAPIGIIGNEKLALFLTQDGTGSRTVTWPGTVKWTGSAAPTLTTTAAAIDIVTFIWDGTNYWGVLSPNFG